MQYNVTLDKEMLEENIEMSTMIEGLKVKGTSITSLDLDGVCLRFTEKAVDFLKVLVNNPTVCYVQDITTVNDCKYTLVNIINTKSTAFLFETLRKVGIAVSVLRIGISPTNDKLYLHEKLLKLLNRLGAFHNLQITMYLLSIAYLGKQIAINSTLEMEYEKGVNELSMNIDIEQFLFPFKNANDKVIEMSSFLSDDISEMKIYNTRYSTFVTTSDSDIIGTYGKFEVTIGGTKLERIILNYGAKAVNPVMYIITDVCIVTNMPMCMIDAEPDSLVMRLCSIMDCTLTIRALDKFRADTPYKLVEEFGELDEKHCLNRICNFLERYKCSSEINIIELEKSFGLTFEKDKSIVDVFSIRDMYKDDLYAQQLYTNEKEYYKDFDLKELTPLVKAFANNTISFAMFLGDSGSGKSTAARVLAARCGLPCISINFSVNIEESDLFGTMIPNPNKKTSEDPEFVWTDGIITKAIRNGYVCVLEELNFARAGVLGKLNSLLDENRQIDLTNGETVKAHPNFKMIATSNISYEGTNRMNKALINRFELVHIFEDLNREETINVIINRTGYSNRTNIEKIYTVYEAIKKYSKEQNLGLVVSIRQLLNIFKQGKYYKTAYDCVINNLVNVAFAEEDVYRQNFVNEVLKVFNLKFKI